MISRAFVAASTVALISASTFFGTSHADERPNVIMLLVDDLGWKDIGCYGNDWIETPNIDKLGKEGVRFTDFYANGAVCSPTRAALQSGQYQNRFSLTAHIPGHYRPFEKVTEPPNAMFLPPGIPTVGETMKGAGYATAYYGKWHLGTRPPHLPQDQGYEEVKLVGGSHFAPGFRVRPKEELSRGEYQTDYLTQAAADYIGQASKGKKPFFLTVSYFAVHIPLQAKREKIAKYEAKPRPEGVVTHPVYAAMVEHVDDSIGGILKSIDAAGIAKNTIVVFTSDNGGLYTRYDGQGYVVTTQAPLRGEKGTLYEGGVRIPTIIRWPGRAKAGGACAAPAMSMDLYPTFLAAAGIEPPKDHVMDGRNLVSLLENPEGGLNRKSIFWHYPHYHHSRPASAIRSGHHKLIHFYDDDSVELYDLKKDIGETHNLAKTEKEMAQRMLSELNDWRSKTNALKPYWNERYKPERAAEWWNKMKLEPIDLEKTYDGIRALPFDGPLPPKPTE